MYIYIYIHIYIYIYIITCNNNDISDKNKHAVAARRAERGTGLEAGRQACPHASLPASLPAIT